MTDGLLLIHAFPLDARMWQGQAGGPRTVAPSLPGFGGTEGAGEVMTMAAAAGRCVDAIEEAGLDRVVVCGSSMGGYVAFELWRAVRDRVAGLIFANTRAEADTEEGAERRRELAAHLRREGNVLALRPPPLLSENASGALREQVGGWIGDQLAESIAAAALGMAERPDSTPDLGSIDVETLVITSDQDELIDPALSAAMAEQIPGARLAIIEGAGHLPNLEAPAAFGALLREHLILCGVDT